MRGASCHSPLAIGVQISGLKPVLRFRKAAAGGQFLAGEAPTVLRDHDLSSQLFETPPLFVSPISVAASAFAADPRRRRVSLLVVKFPQLVKPP
jgi:hypothetical protein